MSTPLLAITQYCERLTDTYWAEPLNAFTNLAFLFAAGLLYRQYSTLRGAQRPSFMWSTLIALVALIGVGSFLWHTQAQAWMEWADVLPILGFISLYFWLFLRRVVELKRLPAMMWFILFQTFNIGTQIVVPQSTLNGSIFYLPTLLALMAMILYLRLRTRVDDSALIGASGLFTCAIALRTEDRAWCGDWPWGTHFIWHLAIAGVIFLLGRWLMRHGAERRENAVVGVLGAQQNA